MALKKDFEVEYNSVSFFPWGEDAQQNTYLLQDAYIKVDCTEGSKFQQSATVSISSGNRRVAKTYNFSPDLEGPNFIAQAYEHLKTLPEFEGAVDC